MEYLGNKASYSNCLVELTAPGRIRNGTVSDLFAGTGAVSLAYARAGFKVSANDNLPLSAAWTRTRLLGSSASFEGLEPELGPYSGDPIRIVVKHLSALEGIDGWVTLNYSPQSRRIAGIERKYLTEENARRIDAVRHQIRKWRPRLTAVEHSVLLTCLVEAVTEVSNVAGTYGAYLKSWKQSALRPLIIRPYTDFAPNTGHRVTLNDAEVAAATQDSDIHYADPPYTKRQYAAYYHLLNSIVTDAEPDLVGHTGLPDWRSLASEWCYKRKAPEALDRLVNASQSGVFALSYSSDGHIRDEDIREILGLHGSVVVHEFPRRRYRSSTAAKPIDYVTERLYVMTR